LLQAAFNLPQHVRSPDKVPTVVHASLLEQQVKPEHLAPRSTHCVPGGDNASPPPSRTTPPSPVEVVAVEQATHMGIVKRKEARRLFIK